MMELSELNELGGWELQPELSERICGASHSFQGKLYDANPALLGAGKGKVVLLFQAFRAVGELGGNSPRYRPQSTGSCVGRTGAMVCDELAALAVAAGTGVWPGLHLAACVYGFARVEVGRVIHGQRIRGEGANVPYGVEALATKGILPAKAYRVGDNRVMDFTGRYDDDTLCDQWGDSGVPDALEPEARTKIIRHWAAVNSYEEARDAVAGGCPVYFGTSQSFWGRTKTRDSQGILRRGGTTAHSWHCNGTIDDGELVGLVLDNRNWGDDWCSGPEGPYPIGPGRFVCVPEDWERLLQAGEAFAVSDYAGLDAPANVIPDFTKW